MDRHCAVAHDLGPPFWGRPGFLGGLAMVGHVAGRPQIPVTISTTIRRPAGAIVQTGGAGDANFLGNHFLAGPAMASHLVGHP